MKVNTIFVEDGLPTMDYVGDFEARYRAEIDPWEQSGQSGERAAYYSFAREKLVRRLTGRVKPGASGLEIGCGFGYLTGMLAQFYTMTGLDVSETALARARELNPGIEYVRNDITAEGFVPPQAGPLTGVGGVLLEPGFHFAILSQCWWYVLHEIRQTLENSLSCLTQDGLLVIHQAFLKEQKYGRDIADGFEGAVKLLMSFDHLRLIEASYEDSGQLCYFDGLIMLRKV